MYIELPTSTVNQVRMSRDNRGVSPQVMHGGGVMPSTSSGLNNFGMAGGGIKTASLNEIWEDLKSGIEAVYSQQTMSKPRYMTLYS